ncbi:hypothetical protein R82526_01031 [Ralstonia mannitolilytica]|nr:hypothetical protein R82526_01031 [Ralstonia mannitolilytica]CAJ0872782.1 hypothetical protein R76727_02587 [Ralstonia mannitolilytica]
MRHAWLASAVAAMGHLAFLQMAGVWTPRTASAQGQGDRPLLLVSLLPVSAGEAVIASSNRSEQERFTRVPAAQRGTPLLPSSSPTSIQPEGAPRGTPLSEDVDGIRFYTSTEVDRQALPASALELLDVMALVSDASPMTLRVYIGADGVVVRAEIVRASQDNRVAAARLALIVMASRFVPAKRLGADVATVRELEFQIEPSSGAGPHA